MEAFIHFLQTYEVWFYILFGAVELVYLRKLIMAYQEMHSSLFGLERENAHRKISFYLTIVGMLGIMIATLFIVLSFVAPAMPGLKMLNTPTIDVLATPTATLAVSQTADASAPAVVGTPSMQPSPTPASEGCIINRLEWISPQPGEELDGIVELKGTVDIANLGFYKYEYAQTGSDKWFTIAAGNTKVVNNTLGQWNTSQVLPGDYLLRLVVSDNANQLLPACVVSVKITQP
jgi:hypothetical protein